MAAIDAARMKTPGSEGHLDDAFYRMLVRFCAGASGDIAGLSVRGAESPLESIVRLRLQRMGLEPVIQLPIGKYRADIVIGDRLVIECDGTQHATAEQFVRDRDRDALFAARGYRVLRFTYAQVMQSWDSLVVPAILAALHGSGDLHGSGGFLHGSGRNRDFS
ncbi:endonuclease domain-containing protein [Amnibacterium flavum]|uniref:endonuclease domain-containing protein n=1 Tax=Amnibacterium flavum TaxID=2173173 RepID=UPI001402C026|nr:DUF559 domain-containing protein [Amnibacterium flavum]